MSFTNKHPMIALMLALFLSMIVAFIVAIALAMIRYYKVNSYEGYKVPEDSEQLVVKKSTNMKL
jgi:hypothetical protein